MKKNSILVTISAIAFIVTAFAASLPSKTTPPKFKNLKVLPKNISEAALDKIMDNFNYSLGVSCDYCHSKKDKTNDLAFELDKKPEKNMARKMMVMTNDMNKKYFGGEVVYCITCHRQKAYPEIDSIVKAK
jgi:Photosynthetic reaction centre cytochrome C subunit